MAKYGENLPAKEEEPLPEPEVSAGEPGVAAVLAGSRMRCGGCGAKVLPPLSQFLCETFAIAAEGWPPLTGWLRGQSAHVNRNCEPIEFLSLLGGVDVLWRMP